MVAVTIVLDETSWKMFQKQSIDMGIGNSVRIQQFINEELKKQYEEWAKQ
jgi:hypothetical protein